MTDGLAADLQRYLQQARDGIVGALDGLSEYDVRRPLTASGTNLLGLVKHLVGIELGYLGECAGRPPPVRLPWDEDGSVWDGADMWATADQTREYLLDLYRVAWRHSDESIAALSLDAPASVPWWPEERRTTTFGHLLVRVTAETAQHAGHADIVRELIDGRGWSRRRRPHTRAVDGVRRAGPGRRRHVPLRPVHHRCTVGGMEVGVAEARRRFKELLDRVVHGETIQITRRDAVVAVLGPPPPVDSPNTFGAEMRAWRERWDVASWPEDDPFSDVRDRSPGRDAVLG